jgi:hypothetical protein
MESADNKSIPYLYTINESNHDTNLYLISLKKNKNPENRKKINDNLIISNARNKKINENFNFEYSKIRNYSNKYESENKIENKNKNENENFNTECPLGIKRKKMF